VSRYINLFREQTIRMIPSHMLTEIMKQCNYLKHNILYSDSKALFVDSSFIFALCIAFHIFLVQCKHKKCYHYSWSAWSASCGDVTRSRKKYYEKDVVTYVQEVRDCDAYPKTCELYDTENKKMDKCLTIYKK